MDNFVYSITIGVAMIYGISIVANLIINFVLGGGSNDSANQLLFENSFSIKFVASNLLSPYMFSTRFVYANIHK